MRERGGSHRALNARAWKGNHFSHLLLEGASHTARSELEETRGNAVFLSLLGNKVDLEGSIRFLLQHLCAPPSPCWLVAEEWVWDTVHASITHSQPMSLEAMTAAGSFRKASLALKELDPFLPLEKSPEQRHPGSCPTQEETHPWKRAKQRESWSSKADPPTYGAWNLPCLWTSIAGGGWVGNPSSRC